DAGDGSIAHRDRQVYEPPRAEPHETHLSAVPIYGREARRMAPAGGTTGPTDGPGSICRTS
ncbi:hypothetical protein R0K30_21675, partial [Bacillus sp. SIMBA_154]|uniref:hypothetical protein n=1 Tax=Bacillus sp. SIMBA_154 TaxID=3080859 RepID=UPI00397DD46B